MSLDPTLYTRDWHLQDLALERLALGDLDDAAQRSVQDHLAGCPGCEERHRAIVAELAVPLPELGLEAGRAPEPAVAEVVPLRPDHTRWLVGGLGTALALAAGVLVILLQPVEPQDDPGFQARGSELVLEVYRQNDDGAVRLQTGDTVRPGDHLGFRVASQDAGYLLVLGIDSTLEPYPCYPSVPSHGAVPWTASPRPVQIDAAVRLDAIPGQERIVALLCEEALSLDVIAPTLRQASTDLPPGRELPHLDLGCLQRELRLNKRAGAL